ncbi:MAG: hypothetical protein P8Y93_09215 [Acidobacteriota bacterium]
MPHQQRARPSHWRHLLATLGEAVAAALSLSSAEIGDVGTTTVEAQFSGNVNATDCAAGVTIKVNSVSQTISSGTRQADHSLVYFVITPAVDVDDTVTWEYDDDLGDYADDESNPMGDIVATPAKNYVGSHLRFNVADDAVWVGAL